MIFLHHLLQGSLRNLSHTYRYNTIKLIHPENVAEHCFYASFYALALYEDIKATHPREYQEKVDEGNLEKGRLLSKVICHDYEERLSGDITLGFKIRSNSLRSLIEDSAQQWSESITSDEKLPQILNAYCEEAKDTNTIEGQIIKLVDICCVAAKFLEEITLGNKQSELRFLRLLVPYVDKLSQDSQIWPPLRLYYKQIGFLATNRTHHIGPQTKPQT